MTKAYKSAIDLWLAAILLAVPSALLFTGVSIAFGLHMLHWHENLGRIAGILFVGGAVVVGALYATLLWPCRYLLGDDEILVRSGVLEWRIPYASIRRLELSCSFWLAPALSVWRVKIVLADGSTQLISPHDRTHFVSDLRERMEQRPVAVPEQNETAG
jgi:hypothetical protein